MNGVDLLFIIIGLMVLWGSVEFVLKYWDWVQEDKWVRRDRQRERMAFQLELEEVRYRTRLKWTVAMVNMKLNMDKFTEACSKAADSLNKFITQWKASEEVS